MDGANPLSLGRLVAGLPAFAPATAEAVVRLLRHYGVEFSGMRVAVIGRSTVVGKPLAHLLLSEHATVTIARSRTKYLPAVTREAEIVVAAVGRAGLVTAEFVGPAAIVLFPRKFACVPGAGGPSPGSLSVAAAAAPDALARRWPRRNRGPAGSLRCRLQG